MWRTILENSKRWCICEDWAKGMKQITGAQLHAYVHGIEYTAEPFMFCPWCQRKLLQHSDEGE